jgi:hypothetical protein
MKTGDGSRDVTPKIVVRLALLLVLLLGFFLSRACLQHALLVYLASWLFVLAVAVGSLALLLIHALTGGAWGERLRVEWLAAIGLLPYLAVAVIPLLLGMHALFPWLQPNAATIDPAIQHQRWYLNAPGLLLRTVAIFALWLWLGRRLRLEPAFAPRPAYAAAGLIAVFISVSILAVDWVMSLVPRWHSTDVGLLIFSSQLLIAFALAVLMRVFVDADAHAEIDARVRRDFGNLLLAMVLGWAYVSFMDYLTAWIADQPAETAWYLPRMASPWQWVAIVLAVLGLGVPFFSLLPGRAKSSWRVLTVIAVVTLFAQCINVVWLILPGVVAQGVARGWGDPLLCAGLLGLCATRYRALLISEGHAR